MIKLYRTLTMMIAISLSVSVLAQTSVDLDTSDVRAGGTPVGDLIRIPIERQTITEDVFYVSGLANVYAINTPEGAIVVDTGFAHQSAKQMALLKEVISGPVKYIFLPQGQQDDVGGIAAIKDEQTQIIMTRAAAEYMPFRQRATRFLRPRYAALYSWATELGTKAAKKKKVNPYPYQPITPDIMVEDHSGYAFELGGKKFEIIALPGAEGINSAGLWMPKERILFAGGGSVGPEIPMWPNIGTVRADRNRVLERYLQTINTMIALKPAILLPGQDDPMLDEKQIMSGLIALRDASQHVHDEIWAGLSEGKDVYQLMREVKLPEHLAGLSQQHGRVEWTVRETVNQTGGWFAYRYTSELYPYRPHEIYPDLVEMAGVEKVIAHTRKVISKGELERAMMMAEAVIEAEPNTARAIELQRDALTALLKRAQTTHKTFSEIAWLQAQIGKTKRALDTLRAE